MWLGHINLRGRSTAMVKKGRRRLASIPISFRRLLS
jgi:hypothetical protein